MSDTESMTQVDSRAAYIAGMRAIADLLEDTPDLPLPNAHTVEWSAYGKGELARLTKLIPGKLTKNDPGASDYDGKYFILRGNVGGMPIELWSMRETVCTRVVTGTETVELPAVEAQPARTETREVVEWVCEPLLAEAAS